MADDLIRLWFARIFLFDEITLQKFESFEISICQLFLMFLIQNSFMINQNLPCYFWNWPWALLDLPNKVIDLTSCNWLERWIFSIFNRFTHNYYRVLNGEWMNQYEVVSRSIPLTVWLLFQINNTAILRGNFHCNLSLLDLRMPEFL